MAEYTLSELTARVTFLEQELHRVKSELGLDTRPWWEQIAGSHKDDSTYPEFLKELKRQRRADYRAAEQEAKAGNKKKAKQKKRAGAR